MGMGFRRRVRMFSLDPATQQAREIHFRPELFNYHDAGVDTKQLEGQSDLGFAGFRAFKNPELARATHILFATKDLKTGLPLNAEEKAAKKAKAEAVLDRARHGEDFTTLAVTFSEDPSVKENKGEYKFARAKDDPRRAMVPEFEAAAFSLKTNQISDLVLTDYGWHIIKLHEIIPAKKTDFAEVKEKIREHLMQRELEKQMPGYFAQVKKEAKVEILDEKLRDNIERAEKERAAAN